MKNLFKFIEDRYPEYPTPFKARLIYNPESITEKDLIVKGDLDLRNTKITQLPDNLQVGGNLNLRNTKITQLPNNLQVGGNLWLNNTPISKKYWIQIIQMIEDKGGYVEGNTYV